MFPRSPRPFVQTTLAFKTAPRPIVGARMLGMRYASTAMPPSAHPGPRPSRLLMGVVIGGALLGGLGYEFYWKPYMLEQHTHGLVKVTHQPQTITFQELEKHNTKESCWLLINGHVYDATSVLRWHPAGAEIILQSSGGRDATEAYSAVHKPELLTHLPPTAHLGRLDVTTLPPELTKEISDEEEIYRTAEAL